MLDIKIREVSVCILEVSVQRSRRQWLQVLLTREIDRAALSAVLVVSFFCFFFFLVLIFQYRAFSRRQVRFQPPRHTLMIPRVDA